MVDPKEQKRIEIRQRRINSKENRQKAVEYRKMGMSYERIGEQLGFSKQAAHKHVTKALADVKTVQDADAANIKIIELENLDRLQFAIWQKAMQGDPQAIDRFLKVQERRAKLLGLDAPEKVAQTDINGRVSFAPAGYAGMTDEEIDARINELERKLDDDNGD